MIRTERSFEEVEGRFSHIEKFISEAFDGSFVPPLRST
jgi:hypothetical protein